MSDKTTNARETTMPDAVHEQEALLDQLAERFCTTPLPASVCADPIATEHNPKTPRTGTNLLTVREAREVLRYVLKPITELPGATEDLDESLQAFAIKTEANQLARIFSIGNRSITELPGATEAIDKMRQAFAAVRQTQEQQQAATPNLRLKVAAQILQGLMANPERYKYIDRYMYPIDQEQATHKNVSKALKIADALIAEEARTRGKE